MPDYLSITEKILSLTRSMLTAAEASEWDKVQAQEAERELLLKDINIKGAIPAERTKIIASNLEETINLNTRIIDLGLREKTETAKMINTLQKGRKASRAYNGTG